MSKKELLLPDFLELGHQCFQYFELELKYWLFLGLEPAGFQGGTTPSALLVLGPSDSD